MDDTTLCELAAKNAGIGWAAGAWRDKWNPLEYTVQTEAVKKACGIVVSNHPQSVGACVPGKPEAIEWLTEMNLRGLSDKERRATAIRRVIVRAAAGDMPNV